MSNVLCERCGKLGTLNTDGSCNNCQGNGVVMLMGAPSAVQQVVMSRLRLAVEQLARSEEGYRVLLREHGREQSEAKLQSPERQRRDRRWTAEEEAARVLVRHAEVEVLELARSLVGGS